MGLQCNIDARGKRARLIGGLVVLIAGVGLLLLWALPSGAGLAWVIAVCMMLAGTFAIFQARAGWCAMRAMGFKTRL